ncbi:dual specificity protein tyrosine phosphatase CCP1 [[Candida] railenensis]|uniref:protein-tyrosine-phosphatase n=1 Tax=[Candida] railenensis TaxID=45579 RepID=A0A9P0QJD2_9ASCO|nr:dual specificity protein tyrosine phosphatase CCP1 [[Candida] railenensis]
MNHISAGFHSPTATTITTSTHTTVLTHSPGHAKQQQSQHSLQQHPSVKQSQFPQELQYENQHQNSHRISETALLQHSSPMSQGNGSTNSTSIESSPDIQNGCSLNISPKHSRKVSSLSNRNINMKNLSLNLENGSSNSGQQQQQQQQQQQPAVPLTASVNPPRLSRRKTLTLSIPADQNIEPPLITPAVTKTPQIPPLIPKQQRSHTTPDAVLSNAPTTNIINNGSSESSPFSIPKPSFHDHNPFQELSPNSFVQPFTSESSKNLQSPFLMNGSQVEGQFSTDFSGLQISNGNSNGTTTAATATSTSIASTNAASSGTTPSKNYVLKIPEELQESSTLEAYPNGPANVLNGSIFLFSDPDPTSEACSPGNLVDINDYDLVINVAKECKDLSSQFDTANGAKEYIHITWSHTSSISKELPNLVKKIAKYEDSASNIPISKKRKILIHCQCGVSRSACVVVGYFMYKFHIGVNEAYELLKSGTKMSEESFNLAIGEKGYEIDACDRICPNMSLIFELMEFGDSLNGKVI